MTSGDFDPSEFQRRRMEAMIARRANSGERSGLVIALGIILGGAIAMGLALYDEVSGAAERRQLRIEAKDRARLECRIAGGQMESFGTQGTHCIGAKR